MHYTKQVLGNGLTIIKVPSRDAESVVVDILVKTGSRSESEKEAGISHFLEHFLFKGTKKYPSPLAINAVVDGLGGDFNANTGKEHTQFFIKTRGKHLALIFDILTDMVQNPLLDEVEMEKEKGVIIEELNMGKDQPTNVAAEALDKLMWPKDHLGREIIGYKKTIQRFTAKDFREYMQRHYQTTNMLIGVSGNFDEKELDSLIKKYWGSVTKKKGGGWEKAKDKQTKPRLKVIYKENEQAVVCIGFKGFPNDDKRGPATAVLSAILSGGMSSRLWEEVRQKRGLAYYVVASPNSYQDVGEFGVMSGVRVEKCDEAISVILAELKRISEEIVGEEEIKKAKEYLKGKTALALEDNQTRLDWILEQAAFKKQIRTPEEAFARVDAVTAKQVKDVARELFQKNKMSMVVLGPFKDEKKFKKFLK